MSDAAALWSGASYERIAETFAPIHDRIVRELSVAPGEAFLDVACGTGAVAVRAAREGAEVTGLDISAEQLAKARRAAAGAGVAVRLDRGDCQALPYPDAAFDVVASAFGLIFAPGHARAAAEAARVTRPAGRLAFTAWNRDAWADTARELGRPVPPGDDEYEWAREEYVRELLGGSFDLRFDSGEWLVPGTPEALWELASTSAPPLRAWLATLDEAGREHARAAYLRLFAAGELRRRYVLVLGIRR